MDKIGQAEEMKINDDYREYLRLKEEALKKQMEAFEEYRQAAATLRNNYDPKNAELHNKVKEDFKTRSENYAKIMEKARDLSNQANELAKDALRKQQAGELTTETRRHREKNKRAEIGSALSLASPGL